MKITPNTSLFTAISTFPDAAQVRDGLADRRRINNAGVEGAVAKRNDPRTAIHKEVLRQAALRQTQDATKTATPEDAPSAFATGSVRREAPFAEVKPKFTRLGQLIDIKV